MNFQDILKRRLQDIHGFAGGNLEDQLAQNPQIFATNRDAMRPVLNPYRDRDDGPPVEGTPEWQTAMSRAVPVRANEIPQPAASMADPNATRQRAVSFDPQTGKPNENFYRDRGDVSGLYNAEQNWNPHGAKRGFKNSLKSAAMMAAEAVRNNPNHPLEAAIAGAGVGAIGGTAAPNFKNRLERQWKLQQTGGENQLTESTRNCKVSRAKIDAGLKAYFEASFLRQQKGFDNDAKEKGGTLIGQIARARGAMAAAADRLQRARDKGDTEAATDAERDYNDAKAYGLGAANDLNNGYGDLYEAGEGEGGFPYYKRKDATEPTPTVNNDLMPKKKYTGRTISKASLQRYATDHRITLKEAEKVFEGAEIVP
jgi:hypothetical protein